MVEVGIKEYDELPSRIGFKDVDALRHGFNVKKQEFEKLKAELDRIVFEEKKGGI